MVENKAIKVHIKKDNGDVDIKEVILREPTGKEQMSYLKAMRTLESAEPEEFLNAINGFIVDLTQLSKEEVENMYVVDKDEIGTYLMERNLGFAKKFKSFMKD